MKICRYEHDRVGLVDGDQVRDASEVLAALPPLHWPLPAGDQFIANLDRLSPALEQAALGSTPRPVSDLRLDSPVANPGKIIGAPVNYQKHYEEAQQDRDFHHNAAVRTIAEAGLFLKAGSSLTGPGAGIRLHFSDLRVDHEVELVAVIGNGGRDISQAAALGHVAGYTIGLDMSVRGTQDRSLRKSIDSYAVLGPWLVTADEIDDPHSLDLQLSVNGEVRQASNTRHLIFDIPRLIEFASRFFTLHPGDVIMTGTPEGVGPVSPGDVLVASVQGIGSMTVTVRLD